MAGQGDQRGAVAVPLVLLAEEEPVVALPAGVRGQDLGDLVVVPVLVERLQQVGGVAEPEPVVRRRAGGDLVAVVEQQQEAAVGRDRLGQAIVGQHQAHAPVALRLPPRGHRRRGWERLGERRRGHEPPVDRPRTPGPRPGIERDGDPERGAVGQRVDERGLGQARGVAHRGPPPLGGVAGEHGGGGVAVAERRCRDPPGRAGQQQRHPAVDGDGRPAQVDALDDRQPLGVVGADGQRQRHRDRRRVLDLDDDQLATALGAAAADRVHPLHRVPRRDAHGGLDDGRRPHEALAHGHLARRQVPPVVGADPPVERPAVLPRRHQPAGVDDRLAGRVEVADGVQFRCVRLVRNGRWPRGTNDGEVGSFCRSSQ